MSSEDLVKQKVYEHFTEPRWNRYTVKREHPIQFGSKTGVADVVLLDSKRQLAAIIECKGVGYENGGIDQLKSYLSASDAPLGVFANSLDPDDWVCYENLKRGRFREISQSQFESRILKMGPIQALGNLLRRIFRRRPPDNAVDSNPPETSSFQHLPYISNTTRGFPAMQSDNQRNVGVAQGVNGKPYYSHRNGFYWATNHRGIAECIPQHIKQIIHNEEIEIASTEGDLDEKISELREEKSKLLSEKDAVEQEIKRKEQESKDSEKTRTALVIEHTSKMPAPTELKAASVGADGHSPVRQANGRMSYIARSIVPVLVTLALLGSTCYLFVFYASVGDKAFSGGLGSVDDLLNEIINPYAFIQALDEGNWFVLLFPCIFVLLAMVVHFGYVNRTRLLWTVPLSITLLLDSAIALKIAMNIRREREDRDLDPGTWLEFGLNIVSVLLLGLAISVLWSIGFHWVNELWKKVKIRDDHDDSEAREKQIVKERIEREREVAVAEKENEHLQSDLQRLRTQSTGLQEKIERIQAQIHELWANRYSRVVDRNKIEKQIQEFLSGWCRFVAHNEDDDPDENGGNVSAQIKKIEAVAYETLNQYYAVLRDVSVNRDATLQ